MLDFILFIDFDGKDYGVKWFLSSLSQIPNSRVPDFGSPEDLVVFFKMLVMQKIAINDGLEMGLSDRLFFKKRLGVEKSKIFIFKI